MDQHFRSARLSVPGVCYLLITTLSLWCFLKEGQSFSNRNHKVKMEEEEKYRKTFTIKATRGSSVQLSSVAQSCPTLCDPMYCSTPGLPVHHQLPESSQTYVHRVNCLKTKKSENRSSWKKKNSRYKNSIEG